MPALIGQEKPNILYLEFLDMSQIENFSDFLDSK